MKVIALVATRNRPALLRTRALASVRRQTTPPDLVIVVDDRSMPPVDLKADDLPCPMLLMENTRTPGASGAWNTGIYHASALGDSSSSFVAVLDDDDAWHPSYLERCAVTASETHADLVAAKLRWFVGPDDMVGTMGPPETLRAADFLVGNPGIQGSNLFVRLSVLLDAGGFDEQLPSTTDRDLLIRLIDRGISYATVHEALVDHFAEESRPRLSTPGSRAKADGLHRFFEKHKHRMSGAQVEAFQARAKRLFLADSQAAPTVASCASAQVDHPSDELTSPT
jgi:glycosyltransferase involved in cell wall biosynthesis